MSRPRPTGMKLKCENVSQPRATAKSTSASSSPAVLRVRQVARPVSMPAATECRIPWVARAQAPACARKPSCSAGEAESTLISMSFTPTSLRRAAISGVISVPLLASVT